MTAGLFTLSAQEHAVLSDLVSQFAEILTQSSAADDPALARLIPSVYPDDQDASREFRRLTEADSVTRRQADAAIVASALAAAQRSAGEHPGPVPIDDETSAAWMRTLAALRLVLASRLGIATGGPVESSAEHVEPALDDPMVGIYEWLGYQLERIVVLSS